MKVSATFQPFASSRLDFVNCNS